MRTFFPTLEIGRRAFVYHAPRLWNCLPIELRQCETKELFKKQLKTFLWESYDFLISRYNCYRTWLCFIMMSLSNDALLLRNRLALFVLHLPTFNIWCADKSWLFFFTCLRIEGILSINSIFRILFFEFYPLNFVF